MGCLNRFLSDHIDAGRARYSHSNKLMGLGVILTREAVVRGELNGHSHKSGMKLVHTEQALAHSSWFCAWNLEHLEAGKVLMNLSTEDDGLPEV